MMISGRADFMDGGINSAMEMNMGGSIMNGRGSYRPPDRGRGICRDYHSMYAVLVIHAAHSFFQYLDNGYCARGAFCKYSHGDDAVVPGQLFPMNSMAGPTGFGSMMGPSEMAFPMAAGPNAQYNPHERIDMRPMPGGSMGMGTGRPSHSRTPMLPRHGDVNGSITRKPGELPVIQDLTPQIPEEDATKAAGQDGAPTNGHILGSSNIPPRPELNLPMNPMVGMRNGFRQAGRNGPVAPKGTFTETPSFRGERRNDKTLVVEKIPEDKLSLGAINDWFKRFGTVTNVAVDTAGAKALVSFANHEEAHAAWKSEDAVFGNRFVKVFWHRPMEGHGQIGARMLAASASLVAKVASKDPSQGAKPPATTSSPAPSARKVSSSSAVSALAAKQQLLEKQIAEQKSLMERLSSASAEEKREIMARLRKLNEEMKPSSSHASVPSPSSTSAHPSRGSTPWTEDRTQKELERLDKELELHHVSTTVDGEGEENTDELKARLEKLKAEVRFPQ